MPGAQPRRSPVARLFSSVERGVNVSPGPPGIRRTFRAITRPVESLGWITPTPVTVTGELIGWLRTSYGTDHPELDKAMSDAEAWAGAGTVDETGHSISGYASVGMILDWIGVTHLPVQDGHGYSRVLEGAFGLDIYTVRLAGMNAAPAPTGATVHPDDEYVVMSTQVVGLAEGLAAADGSTTPVSVRQLDPANYTYGVGAGTGAAFHTPAMISAAPVVATATATVPDPGLSLDDQNASLGYVEFDVSWDVIGGVPEQAAVYLLSLDTWAPSGASWGVAQDDKGARLIATTGLDFGPFGQPLATWTAVVQPPRYRIPAVTPSLWSTADHYYYADAGLWLGGDFTDLTGYPTALPADCSMLEFVVLPPGDDPGDETYTAPWADYNIYDIGGGSTANDHFDSGDTTPDPGSHLWVLWWGPNGLVSLDPTPSTTDPMSLVPAVLAADGTA